MKKEKANGQKKNGKKAKGYEEKRMSEKDIAKTVRQTITQFHMIEAGDTVVIGVSGGPDSVCLLDILRRLAAEDSFRLHVVHVNHGLRQEAQEEEQYVEELCRQWAIPCTVFHEDIRAYAAAEGCSVEEAGRKYRYQCFEQVMKEQNGNRIAVAHHRNDRAETMLFHMVRGTGMKGMAGIPAVRGAVIRPLFQISRQEIMEYLTAKQIRYYTDSSNASNEYSRNRIRNQVMPVLDTVNEQAAAHMAAAADAAAEYWNYVEEEAIREEKTCVQECGDKLLIRAEAFQDYAPLLQRHIIYRTMLRLCGTVRDLEQIHVEQVQKLFEKQSGKRIRLPYEMLAERVYDGVRLWCGQDSLSPTEKEWEPVYLEIPGVTRMPGVGNIICKRMPMQRDMKISKKCYTKVFDYDKISEALLIRTPRQGDYLIADAQGSHKKLSRYFIDSKLPREERQRIPVLADGDKVWWIIGMRISEDVKVTEETRELLQIEIQFEGEENG